MSLLWWYVLEYVTLQYKKYLVLRTAVAIMVQSYFSKRVDSQHVSVVTVTFIVTPRVSGSRVSQIASSSRVDPSQASD